MRVAEYPRSGSLVNNEERRGEGSALHGGVPLSDAVKIGKGAAVMFDLFHLLPFFRGGWVGLVLL